MINVKYIILFTVLSTWQNGKEKTVVVSDVYSNVSFSAPNKIASSKSIAKTI